MEIVFLSPAKHVETHRAHANIIIDTPTQRRQIGTTPEKRSTENKIKINLFPTSFHENSFCSARRVAHEFRTPAIAKCARACVRA